jgi:hypothetical protein
LDASATITHSDHKNSKTAMNFLSLFGERYFLYCSINVPMNTNRILSLSFGCFISAASYAAVPDSSSSGEFAVAASAQRPFACNRFSLEEDQQLRELVAQYETNPNKCGDKWVEISRHMPNRNPKQCKERWRNYLNPTLNSSPWTPEEDALLEQKFKEIGPKWARIATFFTGRTDMNCKNRCNTIQRRIPKAQQQRRGRPISAIPKARQQRRRPIPAQTSQPLPQMLLPPPQFNLDDDSVLLSPLPLQQNNFDLDSLSPCKTDDDLTPLDDDSMLLRL